MSYIHQFIDSVELAHPLIAKYEDFVVSIVFTLWIYDWFEDRGKRTKALLARLHIIKLPAKQPTEVEQLLAAVKLLVEDRARV